MDALFDGSSACRIHSHVLHVSISLPHALSFSACKCYDISMMRIHKGIGRWTKKYSTVPGSAFLYPVAL
jgi:hypothetical protein